MQIQPSTRPAYMIGPELLGFRPVANVAGGSFSEVRQLPGQVRSCLSNRHAAAATACPFRGPHGTSDFRAWTLRTFQTVSGRSSVSRNADLLRTARRIGRVSRHPNLRVVGPKSPRVRRCELQEGVADRRGIHACLTRHNAGRARR